MYACDLSEKQCCTVEKLRQIGDGEKPYAIKCHEVQRISMVRAIQLAGLTNRRKVYVRLKTPAKVSYAPKHQVPKLA